MAQSPTTALPLSTLSDNNKAPKSRVSTASDAQTIVQSLFYSNRERARFNAKIKGMLDGNPPYDPVKLRQNAQSYRANVNFMEGESQLSAALVPYYDLFAGAQTYAEVKLYLDNPDDTEYKSRIATEEFDCLLKKYQAFDFNMQGVLHDYVAFGKGFTMFPKEWGWHFLRVAFNRVYVPDGTDASIEKLEVVVVREKMQVHTLWNYIEKEKSKEAGWNRDAVCEAIRKAMPEERTTQSDDTLAYEWVQQRMRDHDIVEGTRQPTVPIAHLLVKEFDGKITHLMVEETQRVATGDGQTKDKSIQPQFLFKKVGRFTEMRNVLSSFFFETLDGSWNGARGLGAKIYSSIEIKNRLMNKTVDNSFLASGLTVQAENANALTKASLVQVGNINVLPPGFTVIQGQLFVDSSSLIGTNNLLDQTISSNTGIFKAKMEKPQGNPRTAKEVEIQYQNATVLSNSGVARFYRQLDPFYAELYRRVTEEKPLDNDKSEEAEAVREFRKRCQKRGVTVDDLKKVESVRAVRNIGNGSVFQRQQSLERFTPFIQMLPEQGRQNWMDMLIAAEFGQNAVPLLNPKQDELRPTDHHAMAMLENAAMKSGAPVAWTQTQNNVIHAMEHLKAMSGAAESLQAGADPMEVLAFLEVAGPHVQIHMSQLANDPSRQTEFKALTEEFKKVAAFTDQLHDQVQQQQEEQAQQQQEMAEAQAQAQAIAQGTDPDTMIKAAQAEQDMAIKRAKAEQQLRLKEESGRQKLAAGDIKLAAGLRNQAIQTAAKAKQAAKSTTTK